MLIISDVILILLVCDQFGAIQKLVSEQTVCKFPLAMPFCLKKVKTKLKANLKNKTENKSKKSVKICHTFALGKDAIFVKSTNFC